MRALLDRQADGKYDALTAADVATDALFAQCGVLRVDTVEELFATAMAFGDTWEQHREILNRDRPVLIEGTISDRSRDEDDPPIFVDSARPLSGVRRSGSVGVCIELRPGDDLPPDAFDRAREAAEEAAGDGTLYVEWRGNGDGTFRDATETSGLGFTGFCHGIVPADFDSDGDPEVLAATTERALLALAPGLPGWSGLLITLVLAAIGISFQARDLQRTSSRAR